MAEQLHVSIRIDPNAKDLEKEIRAAIERNQVQFIRLFERLVDNEDARTTILDDTLYVAHLSVEDGEGSASVEFSTEFYSGCKDLHSVDDHEAELPFTIQGDRLEFAIELPIPSARDPDD